VLFGAGLSVAEILRLQRSHHVSNAHQQILQVAQGAVRQVPVNQWIMGKRYGSYTRNPLTHWLKSRKDDHLSLFINPTGQPLSEAAIQQQWQTLIAGILTLEGHPPTLEQAQQTWCVEMLMRGIDLPNLQILTGWEAAKLQPYVERAREKAALEQAIHLDQKA
jgi:site-specific recombinase XerD